LVLLGLLSVAGCKGGDANLPTLAPVKGKVTLDGNPVTSGQVTLYPLAVEKGKEAGLSAGHIDSSGNYEIFTGGHAGAPLGQAKITVSPSMVPQPGAKSPSKTDYNPKYREVSRTPLTYTVVENAAAGTYDLQLKK
jgi:hypothetical protein